MFGHPDYVAKISLISRDFFSFFEGGGGGGEGGGAVACWGRGRGRGQGYRSENSTLYFD